VFNIIWETLFVTKVAKKEGLTHTLHFTVPLTENKCFIRERERESGCFNV